MKETPQVDEAILRERIEDALNNFQVKGIAAVKALNQTIELTHQILAGSLPKPLEEMQQDHIETATGLNHRFRLASRAKHDHMRRSLISHAALHLQLGQDAPPEVSRAVMLLVDNPTLPGRRVRMEARRITAAHLQENRTGKLKRYYEFATRDLRPRALFTAAGIPMLDDPEIPVKNILDSRERNDRLRDRTEALLGNISDEGLKMYLRDNIIKYEQIRIGKRKNLGRGVKPLQNTVVAIIETIKNGHTRATITAINKVYMRMLQDDLGVKKLTDRHLLFDPHSRHKTNVYKRIAQEQANLGLHEPIIEEDMVA